MQKYLMTMLCLIFILISTSCASSKHTDESSNEKTKINIYMEKTIAGQTKRMKIFTTESDGPFVIELHGADMHLTMKEPPKALEEEIKKDIKESENKNGK
jgi:hypothetical protein